MRLWNLRFLPILSCVLQAQSLVQVGLPVPPLLDLQGADAARLLPADTRDPAQIEAARQAWSPLIAPFKQTPALRLRLPQGPARLGLLLAASQALKAQNPDQMLYLAYEVGAPSLWDANAWGALQGGLLTPEDLGADPSTWRDLLVRAQEQMPGRPWFLWAPVDPGARTSMLLGDGGRLVVPPLGAAARLAAILPGEFTEVEGGLGDLTLRHRRTGEARRWRFLEGDWRPVELPKERHEVAVTAKDTYDVGALMARMRATQLRDRAALQNGEARVDVDLHMQGAQGTGFDLGFTFRAFERLGETEELLQKEIRVNGVKANLQGGVQVPIIEARTSMAAPVALSLTERYHYEDGGPGDPAGTRRIRFQSVDRDPLLPEGELLVSEATGRILEERSQRSDLPGKVKSERRVLRYGEPAPGLWRVQKVETFERWVTSSGVAQVQRNLVYTDFRTNTPDFEARRHAARSSQATMLKQTLDGLRYYNLQKDGSRQIEQKAKTSGRALGGVILVDPGLRYPVMPLLGLAYFDFDAFGKGIQLNAITAIVFNRVEIGVPRLPGGFDFGAQFSTLLLPSTELPVKDGKLLEKDGVARQFGDLALHLGKDLGLGFRLQASGRFEYNRYSTPREDDYLTPGYVLPPSGLTQEWRGALSWQARGFQLQAYYGAGRRPDGTYGTPAAPQEIPDGGDFRRWGGHVGYDHRMEGNWWLHGEAGHAGGHPRRRRGRRPRGLREGRRGAALRAQPAPHPDPGPCPGPQPGRPEDLRLHRPGHRGRPARLLVVHHPAGGPGRGPAQRHPRRAHRERVRGAAAGVLGLSPVFRFACHPRKAEPQRAQRKAEDAEKRKTAQLAVLFSAPSLFPLRPLRSSSSFHATKRKIRVHFSPKVKLPISTMRLPPSRRRVMDLFSMRPVP